ncbi:MAG: hypothetical protein LBS68_02685 [Puniceicoccales bacterium]|nr:hypothetical protein [Puniceicoccales bacterium]
MPSDATLARFTVLCAIVKAEGEFLAHNEEQRWKVDWELLWLIRRLDVDAAFASGVRDGLCALAVLAGKANFPPVLFWAFIDGMALKSSTDERPRLRVGTEFVARTFRQR